MEPALANNNTHPGLIIWQEFFINFRLKSFCSPLPCIIQNLASK